MTNAHITEMGWFVIENPELAEIIMDRLLAITPEEDKHGIKITWEGKNYILRTGIALSNEAKRRRMKK